ncbi:FAD-dependent monooxygenase [Kitasatospora sp. NPDC094019]|uniref:FAD-dependent monooxygenase n=1 Tax=Kitasatospora sp. NPDC094019 TaxID=3364091 RepID=UPI00381280DF
MRTTTHTDIVVVGGGPVGMLIAAELGAYGIDVVVLEENSATPDQPKAGTVHARAVQALVRRGYLGLPRVSDAPVTEQFHFAGMPGLTITVPAGEPEPVLKRAQADLEREFEERARDRGVTVLRGHRVTALRQGDDGVEVVAEGPGGSRTYSAGFVVGADGARSVVRREAGFAEDTHPATVSAMMGLVRLTEPDKAPRGWCRTERGWVVAKPVPDGHTLVRTLDCSGPHPHRGTRVTVRELQDEASRIAGYDIPMEDALSLTRFSDFTRLVRHYRKGRVFLAGDAAHVHFPIGGQGLSTGLVDALNLGWKLAHAVRGTAGEGLLDTYDDERRPAAQRVIDNTRVQLTLMRPGPELDPLRAMVAELLTLEQARGHMGDLISAQETVYPVRSGLASRWEGRFLENVPVREGAEPQDVTGLLSDGRPLLLLSGERAEAHGRSARGWAHVLNTVAASPDAVLPCEAVLVRPDGHIAWAPDAGDLSDALRRWFGEPR